MRGRLTWLQESGRVNLALPLMPLLLLLTHLPLLLMPLMLLRTTSSCC